MEHSLTFLFVRILFVLIGIPLFLQKVRRNSLYGYRIEKTLTDDKYWYPVNKSSGKWFIISGVVIIVAVFILPSFGLDQATNTWVMIGLILFGILPPLIIPYNLLKKLQ